MTHYPSRRSPRGFTLIELLVVVAMIAILSGILLPLLLKARDIARKAAAPPLAARSEPGRPAPPARALPTGPPPIIDSLDLKMKLASSYHRIGMDVFTRYRVDCAGRVAFRHPDSGEEGPVLLVVPFPAETLEARDVRLSVRPAGGGAPLPLRDVIYDRTGIYCRCDAARGRTLVADVGFTALGRERFDYALPPARQLQSVAVILDLDASMPRTLPDDALQPTTAGPTQFRWEFRNLVSDRRITLLIPGAEAPLARVLVLLRLVAVAVLLFGAGFWFLSEQTKPGQLSGFRLGHFLLLALTYSLFFAIFAVLEFPGTLGTPVSMAISSLFSLPLLVLHVSRVLDVRFAIGRVVPLALFTLGLVVNGVYGGSVRDYVFIGAAVFAITYVTMGYEGWTARREKHQRERGIAYTARRKALVAKLAAGLGSAMADLGAVDARAAAHLESQRGEDAAARRLQAVRDPVDGIRKEYDGLMSRISLLPAQPDWESGGMCERLERDADALGDRVETHLALLRAELAAFEEARQSAPPVGEGEVHCVACGKAVPEAPFCQQCGTPRPATPSCRACGERVVVPLHLLAEGRDASGLHCTRCGAGLGAEA